jgi:hypothetical protein
MVLAAIGLLVVAGRLWSAVVRPPATSPDGAVMAPLRSVPSGVEFAQPITGLAVTPTAVWVAHGTTIERLDPHTLRVTASLGVGSIATDIPSNVARPIRGLAAAGGDAIWATLRSPSSGLLRVDAASARVVAVIPVVSVAPAAVSDTGSAAGVWVVCCGGETYLGTGQLIRVNPATNRVVARIALPGLPDAVGVGASGVWVRGAAGPIWRVDPVSNRVVATVQVPHSLGGTQGSVLVGRDAVWVSDPASATAIRIDPRSNRISGRVGVAGRALAAASDGTVVGASGGRVLSLGPGAARSVSVAGINGEYTTALAAVAGTIWIAEAGLLARVDQRGLH